MTKMRPTPQAAPAAARSRGPASAFNPSAADPTRSNFLEPRTSLISTDFDGDDRTGTYPTSLPPTWSK